MNSKSKTKAPDPTPVYEYEFHTGTDYKSCIENIVSYLNHLPSDKEFIQYNITSPNEQNGEAYYRYSILIKHHYHAA